MDKVLVFIPMYNCQTLIPKVLRRFTPEIASLVSEILIVDNCSNDQSIAAAIQQGATQPYLPITIIQNSKNYGLGGSHKQAFRYASKYGFQYVVVLHADDQADINDIESILKSGAFKNYECYLGSRFMKGSVLKNYSLPRQLANRLFCFLASFATGRALSDLGSGLNIYKYSFFQESQILKLPNDLTFNIWLLLWSVWQKRNIAFFPISWREAEVSNVKALRQTFQTFSIIGRYFKSPHRLFEQTKDPQNGNYSYNVKHKVLP